MKWTVKIEGKQDQKIVVTFDPKNETLLFTGMYKYNLEWLVFSEVSTPMEIDLERIRHTLFLAYEKMKNRIDTYANISEGFEHIKLIEINEE
jgi:hypothetical protein